MSPKHKTELLACGYIKQNYKNVTPMAINKLIQLFYDTYFYWKLTKNEMKQFLEAKNGEVIHPPKTFKIKDIKFELTLCPNGWKPSGKGYVQCFIEIKDMPSNIKYIRLSGIIGSNLSPTKGKFMCKWWATGNGHGCWLKKLSDCKDSDNIEFHCMVDILGIKYKANTGHLDYKMVIKMNKSIKYEWQIDDELQMKELNCMDEGMYACSDNFGDNNWSLAIYPRGSPSYKSFAVGIMCLRLPFDVSKMDVNYQIKMELASGTIYQHNDLRERFTFFNGPKPIFLFMKCPSIDANELFDEEWIRINASVEIVNIYDDFGRIVSKENWSDFGIIV